MIGSRRGRPSLIGRAAHTAARTAVIAGTATAVSNKVASRQSAPAAAAAPAPPPAGLSDDAIERLQKLAELHKAGILTEAEFADQKARLLA
jgi:Short C-terminal domain